MSRHLFYGFALVMALGGCGEAALMPSGGSCVRAAQCQPGLVCVVGQCTSDLSGLEGGVVPSMDAGVVAVDAGEVDAGEGVDAGEVDAGPIGVDGGPPMMRDAGPGGVDAGPPGTDAGPPVMMDAGTDSGPPPMMDAGTDSGPPPMPDAGSDAGTDAGSSADAG